MDEYNRDIEPEVRIYFKKILKTFSAGLLWFIVIVTMGFGFKMARVINGVSWQNIVFYAVLLLSLIWLILVLIRLWRKDFVKETS